MGRPKKYQTEEEKKKAAREASKNWRQTERGKQWLEGYRASGVRRVRDSRRYCSDKGLSAIVTCSRCRETQATREETMVTGHSHKGAWFCPQCVEARREAMGFTTGY